MSNAYKKVYDAYSYTWVKVELTGLCKKVTGGPWASEEPLVYRQAQYRLFGIPLWTYWISTTMLAFFDDVKEVIYECDCGE